jgi:hypothetical protein
VAIHDNRANRAGSFFEYTKSSGQATKCLSGMNERFQGDTYANRPINIYKAPKGTHAATETTGQSRAQKSAQTAETVAGTIDETAELRKHAAEQAALFNLGAGDDDKAEQSTHGDHINE